MENCGQLLIILHCHNLTGFRDVPQYFIISSGFLITHDGILSESAPPQTQPRNQKLLQPFEPLNNKYSSRETPGQTYYNQSEMQREIQKTKCKLALSPLNFSL